MVCCYTRELYHIIRLGDRYGVGQTTSKKCVDRVSLAVIQDLMPVVLKWPSAQETKYITQGFSVRGLGKVIVPLWHLYLYQSTGKKSRELCQ